MAFWENADQATGKVPLFGPNLNNDQHGGYTAFYKVHKTPPENVEDYHYISASDGKRSIGTFKWHPKHGAIMNVTVHHEHQGKGIATAMYHLAQRLSSQYGVPAPEHNTDRTDAGDAWAKKVGGDLPPRSDWHLWDE